MTYGDDTMLPAETPQHGIHDPVFGIKMKEQAEAAGHECYLLIPGVSSPGKYATEEEFLTAKLLEP